MWTAYGITRMFFCMTFPPLFSATIYVLCYGEYGKWVESIDVEVIKRNWMQSAEEIVILVNQHHHHHHHYLYHQHHVLNIVFTIIKIIIISIKRNWRQSAEEIVILLHQHHHHHHQVFNIAVVMTNIITIIKIIIIIILIKRNWRQSAERILILSPSLFRK